QRVEEGTFREDLYYRLNVVPIVVPPLRERGADIHVLATAFLNQVAQSMGREPPAISDNAKRWLERQEWPGNVRQLRNVMERCVILLDGDTLEVRDLEGLSAPSAAASAPDVFQSAQTFEEFKHESERLFLQLRLQANEWNVKRTAESLGMQRSNLYKKMERYGLK
ncbi:MAG: helix-turn-helix domain-containing protein, partial [Planctomycetota bacterium]|nr:helix-turn-helix domain-containing protein [Planctomycetota bacterium]